MTTVPERSEVPIESTWNHESVFPSFDAWREEYRAVVAALPDIDAYKGHPVRQVRRGSPNGSMSNRPLPGASGSSTCTR